ncbi:MAG: hypothetical protein MRY59_02925 [Aquisalinus sp.]|nr:hypothetical protein [Aquisalinus sp.]
MHITLVTCMEMPGLLPEDEHLKSALQAQGAEVAVAPWNGHFAPFAATDLVLIRTPWDYTGHAEKFAQWLDRLEEAQTLVSNPVALMRWNMNKHYLVDLVRVGAPLTATAITAPEARDILSAAEKLGLQDIVIKPVISAGSKGLARLVSPDHDTLEKALTGITCDMLVQAFVPEIETLGETSLIFFGDKFSHAVVKKPKEGDIRCQEEFGGSATRIDPPAFAIEEARKLLTLLPSAPDYARVDVIIRDSDLILMEVELIEPELFFRLAPEAASLFAERIIAN